MKIETRTGLPCTWPCRALALAALLSSCGSGTAGLLSNDGGGGGSSTTLAAFVVQSPKASPATIALTASGSSGSTLQVELLYSLPGTVLRPLVHLSGTGVEGNVVSLPASPGGTVTTVAWDFASELLDGSFRPSLRLVARLPNGTIPASGDLGLGIGNDPPELEQVVTPSQESSGNVPIGLRVSDSSSDVVTIRAEWRRADDTVGPWHLATPAGLFPQGIETRPAEEGGVELTFFWNTSADLGEEEHEVRLRFTPDDRTQSPSGIPVGVGEPRESARFRVDNNEEPIVALDSGFLVKNPDQRRGIPVPFQLFDEESDEVRVVLQWRRAGESFPELPADRDALETLLADPVERRAHRICTEYPTFAEGRIRPLPGVADALRLPELAADASWILARGLEGRALEVLRTTSALEPVAWDTAPLAGPVAAVPLGDGLTALVLDSSGGWRLREIALATGAVVRTIASGTGAPRALALESGGELVALIASDLSGVWRIERVELASGARTQLAEGLGGPPGLVRGIASLGTQACLFTLGSSLLHLDYRDPLDARVDTVVAGLSEPWGLVVDPLGTKRVYVAERDGLGESGRILAVELDRLGPVPSVVATQEVPAVGLEHPEALALEHDGSRLLALSDLGSAHQLVRIDLGAEGGNATHAIGPAISGGAASLATGADELCLVALRSSGALAISGGVEQRRTIVAYEPGSQRVQIDEPLDPPALPLSSWRIPAGMPIRPVPGGTSGHFVWDSTDLAEGGPALLRAVPFDGERGTVSEATSSKTVLSGCELTTVLSNASAPAVVADLDGDGDLDLASTTLVRELALSFQTAPGVFSAPLELVLSQKTGAVVAADLDGDGDLDLASAQTDGKLRVRIQSAPGIFDFPRAVVTGGPFATVYPLVSLVAADMDGDGDLDFVVASQSTSSMFVYFQDAPGSFDPVPLEIRTSEVPMSIVAADLDGDGDLDLAAATARFTDLAVFFQGAPGDFSAPGLFLGSASDFGAEAVAAGDLDGDGDLDLVVSLPFTDRPLKVYFQQAPGSFGPDALDLITGPSSVFQALATGDLDGDGDMDVAAISRHTKDVSVFFQETPGSFAPVPLFLHRDGFTTDPVSLLTADLDGNGDLDLVLPGHELAVAYRDSRGRLADVPKTLGLTDTRGTLAAADIDGDGTLDLLSNAHAGNLHPSLEVFFQSAPGSFSEAPLELRDMTSPFVAADLDGDGDLDLAGGSSDTVQVHFQTGRRAFDAVPLVLGGTGTTRGPQGLAAGDLDGDGDLDLVVSTLDNDLVIFLQTAPGTFVLGPRLDAGSEVYGGMVAAGDLDGDGDLDLVTSRRRGFSRDLVIFFQVPGAPGTSPLVIEDAGNTFLLTDVDGDVDLDLLSWEAGFSSSRTVKLFLQLEPGAFAAEPVVVGELGFLNSIDDAATADLDGDGDLDLAVSDLSGSHLAVFLQVAPGSFDPFPLFVGDGHTVFPGDLLASDIDGDGDADIAAITRVGDQQTIAVFFGGR